MTMDHLSDGRFVLGLGVSGPQVVEGWYGEPFAKPLARTREYVGIVRDVVARRAPVTSDGPHYPLPSGVTGLGKPLKSTLRPRRERLPIYLAAEGPKNIALTAELADGWLALFYSPHHDAGLYRPWLEEGFARRREPRDGFEVLASIPFIVDDDVERAADMVRPHSPCTSAGWAPAARTSTTTSRSAWATRPRPRRSRSSTWTARRTRRPPRSPRSSSSSSR